jgi:hypothetical protein
VIAVPDGDGTGRVDPATRPHDMRLNEVAHLLVRAYLRACVRAKVRRGRRVAPIVAKVARTPPGAPVVAAESALALSPEVERACGHRERRGVPSRHSVNRDMPEEEL